MKQIRAKRYLLWLLCVILLVIAICLYLDSQKPKFHNLMVELGTNSLTINDFKTENVWSSQTAFVTDVAEIDLGHVGETELILRHGSQEESVTLTVTDTTPPEADVEASRLVPVTGFPEASELVSNIQDASEVTVYYREEPRVPLD